MDQKQARPNHASYRMHRSQVAWQVIVPVILAALILIAATVWVSLATFRNNGDVDRWAAISTIWLVLPVMLGALIVLVALVAIAWALGWLAGFIPPYTHKAQVFVAQIEAGVKRGAQFTRRPLLLVPEIRHLIAQGFRKARGR